MENAGPSRSLEVIPYIGPLSEADGRRLVYYMNYSKYESERIIEEMDELDGELSHGTYRYKWPPKILDIAISYIQAGNKIPGYIEGYSTKTSHDTVIIPEMILRRVEPALEEFVKDIACSHYALYGPQKYGKEPKYAAREHRERIVIFFTETQRHFAGEPAVLKWKAEQVLLWLLRSETISTFGDSVDVTEPRCWPVTFVKKFIEVYKLQAIETNCDSESLYAAMVDSLNDKVSFSRFLTFEGEKRELRPIQFYNFDSKDVERGVHQFMKWGFISNPAAEKYNRRCGPWLDFFHNNTYNNTKPEEDNDGDDREWKAYYHDLDEYSSSLMRQRAGPPLERPIARPWV